MRIIVAPRARRDVSEILDWSDKQFGRDARDRYRRLIERAYLDLRLNPERSGVQRQPDMPKDLRLYHLRHSRSRLAHERVGTPRHFVAFRVWADSIEVVRVLHDAMDLPRQFSDG